MAQFHYTAHTVDGEQCLSARCMGESKELVCAQLKRMGYVVDSISTYRPIQLFSRRQKISLRDLVNLCRRLSVMYGAGLSLVDNIETLAQECECGDLRQALKQVHSQVRAGHAITDAFLQQSAVFPPLFISMIRIGEASGRFEPILNHLAGYLEKEVDLRRKIRQALAYPSVVLGLILVVVTAIIMVVIPVFSRIYQNLGISLPGPTRSLIFISNHMSAVVMVLAGLTAAVWLLFKRMDRLPGIQLYWDRFRLENRLFGSVYRNVLLLRFLRATSITLKAGIQVEQAISIAQKMSHNRVVQQAIDMILQSIRRGGTITEAIKLHTFFPGSIIQAFAAGEESGCLEMVLNKYAESIEQDVDEGIKRLLTKIEPCLVVSLSLIIGFILLAIYLPIFDLMKGLRG